MATDVVEPIQLDVAARTRSKIVKVGLGYEWDTGTKGIVLQADRIHPKYNDLQAEVRVLVRNQAGDSHVHMNNYVITSPEGRTKLLESLVRHPQFRKWGLSNGNPKALFDPDNDRLFEMIEMFCSGVQVFNRSAVERNVVKKRAKSPIQYILDSLILKANRPNLLFAPGGSGKSYLLAATCVGMMTNRGIGNLTMMPGCVPGYFDWEDDFEDFEDRCNTISRGFGLDEPPPVIHYRLRGSTISEKINDIAKWVEEDGITVGFIDSMSAAAGTTGNGQGWDSISHGVFDALGLIPNVTWVIIGHVDKAHLNRPAGAMFGCYSEDTEVLTRTGWKLHKDVTQTDSVLAFNPALQGFGWEHPLQKHVYEYVGDMHRIKTENTDVLVTPNHRMVVSPDWKGNANKERQKRWEFVEMQNLSRAYWRTPYSQPVFDETPDTEWLTINGREFPADAFLRFLGWWIAEGSVTMNGVTICQAEGELAQRIRGTLDEMGMSYSWATNHNRPLGREHEQTMCYLRCRESKFLVDWLRDNSGIGSANKRIPEIVYGLSLRQRQLVLDSLLDGDGSRKSSGQCGYHTISKQLADDVHRLAILTGHGASVGFIKRADTKPNWKDAYIVYISSESRRAIQFNPATQPIPEHYDGTVYCLTVPSGAYVTRRNGKMAVQGNSIQTMNRSCNAWEVRSEQSPGDNVVHMKFHDAKHNRTGLREVIGLAMEFSGDYVTFESESASSTPTNLVDRMTLALMNGMQLTRAELAERLNCQYGSITTILSKDRKADDGEKRFTDVKGGLIALRSDWDGTNEEASEGAKELLQEAPDADIPW